MRSFTSNSEARFVLTFVLTFGVLVGGWESILRKRSGATVDPTMNRPSIATTRDAASEWLFFGNCLVMTGVSPHRLDEDLGKPDQHAILNIAEHEQSPLAFFAYLRAAGHYPGVIVANVSSWLSGTNFEQESALVIARDPLGLMPAAGAASEKPASQHAYREAAPVGTLSNRPQDRAERWLSAGANEALVTTSHKYHLFDYLNFLWKLASTRNLDDSLYQLKMQSWFAVASSATDGDGFLGLDIRYREDWPHGLDVMAEKQLQRMRPARFLTERYWSLLRADIRHFREHGTRTLLVRMPEHPRIREFNETTYAITERLRDLKASEDVDFLDLSKLGPADGVRLFDAVHPDAQAAVVITKHIAEWLGPDAHPGVANP